MRAVVVGATGAIGKFLVSELLADSVRPFIWPFAFQVELLAESCQCDCVGATESGDRASASDFARYWCVCLLLIRSVLSRKFEFLFIVSDFENPAVEAFRGNDIVFCVLGSKTVSDFLPVCE